MWINHTDSRIYNVWKLFTPIMFIWLNHKNWLNMAKKKKITSCFFIIVWLFFFSPSVCRQVTRSSCAVPSLRTPTGSRGAKRLCSCSSWTVCGRSCGSFLAHSNLMSTFWSRCSNTLTPPSLALFWETALPRGWWSTWARSLEILPTDLTSLWNPCHRRNVALILSFVYSSLLYFAGRQQRGELVSVF